MKNVVLIIVLMIYSGAIGAQRDGTYEWVLDAACTQTSDNSGSIKKICYGLEYTPALTGTILDFGAEAFILCVNDMDPVGFNQACILDDNTDQGTEGDCVEFGDILVVFSANTGGGSPAFAVDANVPVIIQEVCLELADGESTTITFAEGGINSMTFDEQDQSASGSGSGAAAAAAPEELNPTPPAPLVVNGSVLPVELIAFTVTPEQGVVVVEWKTATEESNSHFEVEWSTSGRDWKDIGRVEGKAFSNSIQSYSLKHVKPAKGTNYYRLRQVDLDGRYNISPVRSVVFQLDKVAIEKFNASYFPNPTSDVLNLAVVEGSLDDQGAVLQVIDLNGKILRRVDATADAQTFNVAELMEGVYYIQILDSDGIIMDQDRFVKVD